MQAQGNNSKGWGRISGTTYVLDPPAPTVDQQHVDAAVSREDARRRVDLPPGLEGVEPLFVLAVGDAGATPREEA